MPVLLEPQLDSIRWLTFKNETGASCPGSSVLRVTGVEWNRSLGEFRLKCGKVNHDGMHFAGGKLVVTHPASSVPDDDYGYCSFDWPNVVKMAAEPTVGKFVGAENDEYDLKLDLPGFIVLGNIESSNGPLSLVMPGPTVLLALTNGSHALDATQAVDVYQGGSVTSPLVQVPATNDYAALGDDKQCSIAYKGDGWRMVAGECS